MKRILFVEDDEYIRRHYIEDIQQAGYETSGAKNASVAWQLVNTHHFDAVVIDSSVDLAVSTNRCLSEMLREYYPAVLRIALTGQSWARNDPLHQERYQHILIKEFNYAQTIEQLQRIIEAIP
ncbi:MAG TPA: hypothetical protein VJI15_04395 [Candidatus Nanoarchaeia archaeon]|nr:hypothetical protein [Candidatus Nanoarchaeia archaeon]